MNPREKAEEIISAYYEAVKYAIDQNGHVITNVAKRCAILHCQGIIDELEGEFWMAFHNRDLSFIDERIEFWEQVLNEIKQL